MHSVIYVLAIMGCSDGSGNCQQLSVEPVVYATQDRCNRNMTKALMDHANLDYPRITAQCRQATAVETASLLHISKG